MFFFLPAVRLFCLFAFRVCTAVIRSFGAVASRGGVSMGRFAVLFESCWFRSDARTIVPLVCRICWLFSGVRAMV